MRPDQERVRSVLIDSIVIMCQKGLNFNCELKLQGVIGITVDYEDSFVIHINQTIEAASNSNNSVNPSPSCSIKQEPQQSFGGFGESQSHPFGTTIKKEPQSHHQQHQQQEYFPAPQRIKVESNQMANQYAPHQGSQQLRARLQSPPRANLQMALVPVNKNPPRMMRPPGRGMNPAMGGGRMPRQPTARNQRPQFMQPTNVVPPFPSFQSLNMGMQRPPAGAFPRPTRPKKAAPKKQKFVEQEFDDDSYDQFSQDEMSYSQPAKRPRGGGATQGRGGGGGGGGAKKPRGGGATQFAGQVTPGTAGDRSFKLVSRFICDIDSCNASFTMKSNLRRHQKSKHPEYNFGDDDDDGGFDDEGAGEYY